MENFVYYMRNNHVGFPSTCSNKNYKKNGLYFFIVYLTTWLRYQFSTLENANITHPICQVCDL